MRKIKEMKTASGEREKNIVIHREKTKKMCMCR